MSDKSFFQPAEKYFHNVVYYFYGFYSIAKTFSILPRERRKDSAYRVIARARQSFWREEFADRQVLRRGNLSIWSCEARCIERINVMGLLRYKPSLSVDSSQ